MKNLYLLLSPRLLALKNSLAGRSEGVRKRTLVVASVGLVFWGLMFLLSARVLIYFRAVEVIGDILAHHLLAMVLLTFFSLLIFSNIITALSNLYLSTDLGLCHSSPVQMEEVFASRSILTIIDSSWMFLVFGLPVMMAYAFVYRPGLGYYITLFHLGLAMTIIAAGIGILFTMIMVSIFPAERTRDVIMLLGVFVGVALYLMFRFLRPEKLADPDAFFSVMQYVSALKSPDSPYLPTHWITEALWVHLGNGGKKGYLFNLALTWHTALAISVINTWVAGTIYFKGFSKSQGAKRRRGGRKLLDALTSLIKRPLSADLGSILDKDMRSFFRDNTQWTQLLLLGALVVVYLYNFSVLPLERSPIRLDFLQNEIAFLNMGLAGFVLSAVAVRFIFPVVSLEGKAFWVICSSPMSLKRFLWGKYLLYLFPMMILAEALIILTNYLLKVTPFMMLLSSITVFLAVFGIVALGIGFGAHYPRFNYENISQVSTGFGGLMFMIFSTIFIATIIILEAGPVYIIFKSRLNDVPVTLLQWFFIVPSFMMVLMVSGLAVLKPMRLGLKAINQIE